MSEHNQTSGYDVAVLREARRVLEKYVHLSAVRIFAAMDELDSAIELIESAAPTRQANADNEDASHE